MTLFLRLLSLTLLCLGLNFSTTAQCTGTVLLTLGNGDDGEGIAFNPNDGQIYHTSGISDGQAYFEPINLTTLTIGANLFPLNTAPGLEIGGVVWSPFYNAFIFMDSNDDIYSITNTGTLTFLSNLSAGYLRGFIAAGVNMYGVNPFGNNLVLFNTATGATISDIPMTSTAGTVNGATALSHNPANGKDYVIFKMSGSNRHLGEIDLNTGVITYIDNLGEGWAGMTFDNAGKIWQYKNSEDLKFSKFLTFGFKGLLQISCISKSSSAISYISISDINP